MLEHRPRHAYVLFAATALLLAACQSGPPPGASAAPAPVDSPNPNGATVEQRTPNTLDGIYTSAQAQRGRLVFENICSECHTTGDWQDGLFRIRWDGVSVYRFWHYIYERMPEDRPPYWLSREQVTDALTYILQLNGLPSGDAELGSDEDSIGQHWLYWGNL